MSRLLCLPFPIMVLIVKTMIRMDASGRLTLPKDIRLSLNLSSGALLEAEVSGRRLELTPAEAAEGRLRERGPLLVVARQGAKVDVVEAVRQTRERR